MRSVPSLLQGQGMPALPARLAGTWILGGKKAPVRPACSLPRGVTARVMSEVLSAGFGALKDPFVQCDLSPAKLNLLPKPLVSSRSAWYWWEREVRGSTESHTGLLLPVHGAEQPTGELRSFLSGQHPPASSTLGTCTGNLFVPQDDRRAGIQLSPLLL